MIEDSRQLPDAIASPIEADLAKCGKVVKAAGIEAEKVRLQAGPPVATAARLADHVLPPPPVCQWALAVPEPPDRLGALVPPAQIDRYGYCVRGVIAPKARRA